MVEILSLESDLRSDRPRDHDSRSTSDQTNLRNIHAQGVQDVDTSNTQ
jgi:hypothetical protein